MTCGTLHSFWIMKKDWSMIAKSVTTTGSGLTKRTCITRVLTKQFWTTKVQWLSDPDLKFTKTYRCKGCGYLERYTK